jgi:hypothetical protein
MIIIAVPSSWAKNVVNEHERGDRSHHTPLRGKVKHGRKLRPRTTDGSRGRICLFYKNNNISIERDAGDFLTGMLAGGFVKHDYLCPAF